LICLRVGRTRFGHIDDGELLPALHARSDIDRDASHNAADLEREIGLRLLMKGAAGVDAPCERPVRHLGQTHADGALARNAVGRSRRFGAAAAIGGEEQERKQTSCAQTHPAPRSNTARR
jgi:hypothetical protein